MAGAPRPRSLAPSGDTLLVKFEREGVLEAGLGMALKRAFTGEGTPLMKVSGIGRVYVADSGKRISLLRLEGPGLVAITSHGEPLTLRVGHNRAVTTDPNATVAWSGNLDPDIRTNITVGTLLGRGTGEAFQLHFEGQEGFVVVPPYEEVVVPHGQR